MDTPSPSAQRRSPSHEERIRRNVACVNCRNSKVRCRQSSTPGERCQRCAKLDFSCVVDKSHKRITKRSKLEKLEQELDAIKQAVRPPATTNTASNVDPESRLPQSPRSYNGPYADPHNNIRPPLSARTPLQPTPSTMSEPSATSSAPKTAVSKRPVKLNPSKPRTIGSHVVPGVDIDWYFDKYLEAFHPFIPVLRKKDPDDCYEANPTLFWVIIFVTARRYTQDRDFFNVVCESLSKDIWTLLSNPIMSLEAVHALLLMCAWPLPMIRFATDPSTTFAGIAMNVCMLLGLHTGRGGHGEFCVGSRANITSSDEEASSTWIQACVLAQRSASSIGHPPPSIQLNDAPSKAALTSPIWTDLITMFDIQRYLNRLHLAMASHITSNGFVIESLVTGWEDEFETLKPLIARHDTDLSRFLLLAAQQEIQAYYFTHSPDSPGPNVVVHTTRALGTARKLITTALALQGSSRFLTHAPQWAFRSVFDAACLLTSSLLSSTPPPLPAPSSADPDPSQTLINNCLSVVTACSVRDGDLPSRGAALISGFWQCRDMVPKCEFPAMAWPNRLGAGITFWCLHRFNRSLHEAQRSSESAGRALKAAQPQTYGNGDEAGGEQAGPSATTPLPSDPFQEVDWSMFMDDFGWGGSDTIFMGMPT